MRRQEDRVTVAYSVAGECVSHLANINRRFYLVLELAGVAQRFEDSFFTTK